MHYNVNMRTSLMMNMICLMNKMNLLMNMMNMLD